MESEIEAYNQEILKTKQIKDLNLLYFKKGLEDYPKKSMFREKINLVKEMAFEIIKKERSENKKLIENKDLQVL